MSLYDKKLYIKKTDGDIQTANLYTDRNDVGDNYLTFKYNGNTVYAVLSNNGDIDFNVSYNHNLYKIKSNVIVWKTDEYRMYKLYPSTYQTMTELPNDRDWIEFVKYRKNLYEMFRHCTNLTIVPQFDTSNVTYMMYMFQYCTNLTTVPLFNTQNVINMDCMFQKCTNLTTVPLFDTSKVINMNSMFHYCTNLTTVPLFNTSKVINMNNMFDYCTNLITVPLFDTQNVTNMDYMFNYCTNLTTVPLFNTSKVKNMNYMFCYCPKLITVPLFDTQNVTNMNGMFYVCSNLTELPIFDIRSVTNIKNMITGTQITKITFKNKPANLEITPEILGKPDVQITFI